MPASPTIPREAPLQQSPEVIQADCDGAPILLHTTRWEYLEFNPVGAFIWQSLAEPRRFADLVSALTDRYEVTPERCAAETEALLATLLEGQFIRAMPAAC